MAPATGQVGMAPCWKLMHTLRTFALLSLCTACFVNTGCASGSEGSDDDSAGAPTTAPTTTTPESQTTNPGAAATTSDTPSATNTPSATQPATTATVNTSEVAPTVSTTLMPDPTPSTDATSTDATSTNTTSTDSQTSSDTAATTTSEPSPDETVPTEPSLDAGGAAPAELASPGCESSTAVAGDTNLTVDVDGVSRSFILHVPPGHDGQTPVPFIIDLHPLGGSGSQEQGSSGYQRIADAEGLVIAFPNGIDNAWNVGPCCTNSRDVDDVGFAKAIVETVGAQACIDLKRVYAVGFSMGGGMSHYLACQATDTFAAVAPAAFDLLVPEEQTCEPSRPISVLTFRGTQDTTSPFNGGPGPSGRATFEGAYGSFERWREMNGCNDVNTVDGDCTTYEQCDDGVEVALCVAEGGGHATGNANVGWAFLKRFSLP